MNDLVEAKTLLDRVKEEILSSISEEELKKKIKIVELTKKNLLKGNEILATLDAYLLLPDLYSGISDVVDIDIDVGVSVEEEKRLINKMLKEATQKSINNLKKHVVSIDKVTFV